MPPSFDDILLGQYIQLVLHAHASGRWGDGVARAEIVYVLRAAARQDPSLMWRIREAINLLNDDNSNAPLLH